MPSFMAEVSVLGWVANKLRGNCCSCFVLVIQA